MIAPRASLAFLIVLITAAALTAGTAGGSCESLASLRLPDATIDSAQSVAAGAFEPAGGGSGGANGRLAGAFKGLPAFCRVAATLKPSNDSDIKVEVWMPTSGWNGKYEAVGNPGWAGSINYLDLSRALQRGYAASSTDTGHSGAAASASFALGHPEKLIDFGYRSEHEMTVKAKAIIAAFYGNAPKLSYFVGCSLGRAAGADGSSEIP